jgi:hypothetical protein
VTASVAASAAPPKTAAKCLGFVAEPSIGNGAAGDRAEYGVPVSTELPAEDLLAKI